MSDFLELALRVEAATGPDREIDAEIAMLVVPKLKVHDDYAKFPGSFRLSDSLRNRFGAWYDAPAYTASIDVAMSLIPEEMRDEIEITTLYQVARVGINLNHGSDGSPFYGENLCNSIPLALTAAALRALAAQGQPS